MVHVHQPGVLDRGTELEPLIKPALAATIASTATDLRRLLLQDLMHDAALDIGQAEVAAAVAVGQTRVVEATLVQ